MKIISKLYMPIITILLLSIFLSGNKNINNKALEYYNKLLATQEKVLEKDHRYAIIVYRDLSKLYQSMKNYPKALEYHNKLLVVTEKILGKDHKFTAINYYHSAELYKLMKNYPKALEYHNKALVLHKKVLGKEHKFTAMSYNTLGELYHLMKNYPKALEYYNKALVIREKVLGKEHIVTAASYKNLGDFYHKIRNYPKALGYYNKTLVIAKKILGKENKNTAIIYDNLGELYSSMEKYPKALGYYNKALVIREKILGQKHIATAENYNNLGTLHELMSNNSKALKYYNKALVIREKVLGKGHIVTAISYNNLGLFYNLTGNYPKALEYLEKALAIRKKVLGIENESIAISYNNLGGLYVSMENYSEAFKYFKKAVAVDEKVLGKKHASTARSYNNLGGLYDLMGNKSKALEYFNKSFAIREKVLGKGHTSTARNYNNLGGLYSSMGNYQKALEYYQKSLEINEKVLGKKHASTAKDYNNLGGLYSSMGNYQKALEYYQKSLEITEKVLGKKHASMAINYSNLGTFYLSVGDHPQAFKYFNMSLAINEKVLGKKHASMAINYSNLGTLYESKVNYSQALKYYKKSLAINEKVLGKNHPSLSIIYNNLGRLYTNLDKQKLSYTYTKKAFNIHKKNQSKNFSILDSSQKLLYIKNNNNKIFLLLQSSTNYKNKLFTYNKISETNEIIKATLNDWLNYKGSIFNNENNIAILYEKTKDKKIKFKIEELYFYNIALSKLVQAIPKRSEKNKLEKRINKLERDISNREIYLSSKIEEFKEELNLKNINYKNISKYLKDNELYIDYARTEDNYYVWTLDNKNIITYKRISNNSTHKIRKAIKSFRKNIKKISNEKSIISENINKLTKDSKKDLSILYKLLLDKYVLKELDKKYKQSKTTLIISPDGLLNLLPFEALYDKNNAKYLIETKNIKYIPSGKEFLRIARKKDAQKSINKRLTLFSNPDFDMDLTYSLNNKISKTSSNKNILYSENINRSATIASLSTIFFSKLPGTQKEADNINLLLKNTKYKIQNYNKQNATETNLLKVKSPKILHIATHGFFLKDENIKNPLLKSGLVLSGANNAIIMKKGHGIVSGLKLSGLNLKNTDLVVLSACETGVGDINEVGGVVGLNKAFIKAGAKNTVMTLWKVADKESINLISGFYSNIKENKNYSKALQEIKIKMIEDGLHPYFWSGFVINGLD